MENQITTENVRRGGGGAKVRLDAREKFLPELEEKEDQEKSNIRAENRMRRNRLNLLNGDK